MNIHHLELFYYVAKHGGIMEAVRNIPYGIQQPAVSGQVAQLEESLGVTLFQRRPFALTAKGKKLFEFISPFFSSLDTVQAELQGGAAGLIRIGASGVVLREHLPDLFVVIRKRYPQLKIALREGYQAELEAALQREELDLAVTILEKKAASGIQSLPLLELNLVLLVPDRSPLRAAEELWNRDRISEPLICLPAHESICRNFQQGLNKLGVDWFPSIEVSSLDLIETYVMAGFGVGLTVEVPRSRRPEGLRALSLPGFAPVVLGALWRGKAGSLVQVFLDEMSVRAQRMK